jgi:hypothetical protein
MKTCLCNLQTLIYHTLKIRMPQASVLAARINVNASNADILRYEARFVCELDVCIWVHFLG